MSNQLESSKVEPRPQLPIGDKGYYACRTCRRILTEHQWYTEGCEECQSGPVQKDGRADRLGLKAVATPHFKNFVGIIAPEYSWVARFINKQNAEAASAVYAEQLSDDEEEEEEEDRYSEEDEENADEEDNGSKKETTAENDGEDVSTIRIKEEHDNAAPATHRDVFAADDALFE